MSNWCFIYKRQNQTCTPKSIHISGCKLSIYFAPKKLLFLFYTLIFTKHSHQSIYSTYLFNKIFIFLTLSSLSQTQHNPPSNHHQPTQLPSLHHQSTQPPSSSNQPPSSTHPITHSTQSVCNKINASHSTIYPTLIDA